MARFCNGHCPVVHREEGEISMSTPAKSLSVEETILQVIALTIQETRAARAKALEERAFDPKDLFISSWEACPPAAMEAMMNGSGDPCYRLLVAMSDADVRKVEVLVYAGRDQEGATFKQVARYVPRERKDLTAHHLLTKGHLAESLILGWAKLIKEQREVILDCWDPDAEGEEDDEPDEEDDDE